MIRTALVSLIAAYGVSITAIVLAIAVIEVLDTAPRRRAMPAAPPPQPPPEPRVIVVRDEFGVPRGRVLAATPECATVGILVVLEVEGHRILERERRQGAA